MPRMYCFERSKHPKLELLLPRRRPRLLRTPHRPLHIRILIRTIIPTKPAPFPTTPIHKPLRRADAPRRPGRRMYSSLARISSLLAHLRDERAEIRHVPREGGDLRLEGFADLALVAKGVVKGGQVLLEGLLRYVRACWGGLCA